MQRNNILYLKINYIHLHTNKVYKEYNNFKIRLNIYWIAFHLNSMNVCNVKHIIKYSYYIRIILITAILITLFKMKHKEEI